MRDDGPAAAGVVVLTYRFWTTALKSDPSVIGKVVRLGSFGARTATVIGVLEPSVPYPAETEIIANIVTSPHHLSATMVTGRVHRMTELFGRLAPGATLEQARAELKTAHGAMMKEHPEAYPVKAGFQHRRHASARPDYVQSQDRALGAAGRLGPGLYHRLLQRGQPDSGADDPPRRRAGDSGRAGRQHRGAAAGPAGGKPPALRRGSGAGCAERAARWSAILARYASRFSVRALDLTVDSSMLWVGAGLALVAAALLAFVPRLPSGDRSNGINLSNGSVRMTGGARRRLRAFAITQIAASFVLLAGATMLLKTLLALQAVDTGIDTRRVLAINVPVISYGRTDGQVVGLLQGSDAARATVAGRRRRRAGYPDAVARRRQFRPGPAIHGGRLRSRDGGRRSARPIPHHLARIFRARSACRSSPAAISTILTAKAASRSRSSARAWRSGCFRTARRSIGSVYWTDPVLQFIGMKPTPMRIVGIAADIDDEHLVPGPTLTVYQPFGQGPLFGGRLFVHVRSDPYALVTPITRTIRDLSVDQPVERAATLEDVRAEVLTPDRLNAMVFGGFALVALTIAVVGVAGVLAFSVSARTREFGIRLAIGSQPRHLLMRVIAEGTGITALGIGAGLAGGLALQRLAGSYFESVRMPGAWVVVGAAGVLLAAAVVASAWPAMRAARVDVIQALRAD